MASSEGDIKKNIVDEERSDDGSEVAKSDLPEGSPQHVDESKSSVPTEAKDVSPQQVDESGSSVPPEAKDVSPQQVDESGSSVPTEAKDVSPQQVNESGSSVEPEVEAKNISADHTSSKAEEIGVKIPNGDAVIMAEQKDLIAGNEAKGVVSPSDDDKSTSTEDGKSSQQSSENPGFFESARSSLLSSDGAYETTRESCPSSGEASSQGNAKVGFTGSAKSLESITFEGAASSLIENTKVLSKSLQAMRDESGKRAQASQMSEKRSSEGAVSGVKGDNLDENTKAESAVSPTDVPVDKSETEKKDVDERPTVASPVSEGVGTGARRKTFLGISFGAKSADKPKGQKKSSDKDSDKTKSPKKSEPDDSSEKSGCPKKSDEPIDPSERTKSPKKSSEREVLSPKKSKISKKSGRPDEPLEKTKSPKKSNESEVLSPKKSKTSKKSGGPDEPSEKTKSPKKSDGNDVASSKSKSSKKGKSPKTSGVLEPSDKSKSSRKSCEREESAATDSPVRRYSFLKGVNSPQKYISKFIQKLSPAEAKGTIRPILSSSCDPDFFVKSPELSPISNERHFSASYLGKCVVDSLDDVDRIDYSKLAEEEIIPTFLNAHQCYDVMPTSGKVIVLSVDLLVKNAFSALVANEIKAAPLWDSGLHDFVGMLTITDFINVLRHYYYSSPEDIKDIENQSISTWRRITQVASRFIKVNGSGSLSEATKILIQEGIHRIPVFDEKRQCVLFVLTRKRLLQYLSYNLFDKFEKTNIKTPSFFKKTLREIRVGTYENIARVTEGTKVIDALDLFAERGVSSLPVVDEDGVLKDIFGKMDVFALAKEQTYHNLEITVYEVVRKGVPRECAIICTLDESFGTVIQRFISAKSHRIVVIDERRSVVGIISLSDLLKFLVVEPLATMEDSGMGGTSDIIEEGAEGAVGGADNDIVFNDSAKDLTVESEESSALNNMKDLSISKDPEEETVSEEVSKSE